MSRRHNRVVLLLGTTLAAAAGPLQAQLNLGASAGAVRYEQVASTTSLEVNPDLTLIGRRVLFNATGDATTASDGSGSLAGGGTLWGATPRVVGRLQFDGWAQGVYTKPVADSSSYSLLAFGEAAWAGDAGGVGLGAGGLTGFISGQGSVNAVRGSARGWRDLGPVSVGLAVQPTLLSTKVWFTDVSGNLEWDPGRSEISGTALVRQSPATGLDLGGELAYTYHITNRVAFAASAGRYLRDPFQGLPQGFHVNAGVVLTLWRPHPAEGEGVSKGELTDLDLSSLGLNIHGLGHALIRSSPATSKGLSGTGTGSGSSSFGRGHHL